MKKSAVKRSLAFVVIVGIFLTVIGLLLRNSRSGPSMPSFSFLSGRKPAFHSKNNSQTMYRITNDIYSFEADFNNVCLNANAELLALGFVDTTQPILYCREYVFRGKLPYELVHVRISDNQKLTVYSTPESSKYSSPERHAFHYRDGWVSVEVTVEVAKWRFRLSMWLK